MGISRKITWLLKIELSYFPWTWWEFASSYRQRQRESFQLKFTMLDLRQTLLTALPCIFQVAFPLAKPRLPQITHRTYRFWTRSDLKRNLKRSWERTRRRQWSTPKFSSTKIKYCNSLRCFSMQFLFVLITFKHKRTVFEHYVYTEMTNIHHWLELHLQIESEGKYGFGCTNFIVFL